LHRGIKTFGVQQTRFPGGSSTWGHFQLELPYSAGVQTISLRSDDPAVAWVEQSAVQTLPGTAQEGGFLLKTAPVTSGTPVRFFATYGGRTQSLLVTVLPVRITGIEITPERVPSGTTATGTLFLSGPAPAGGVVVRLNSDHWDTVAVPPRVT